MLVHMFLRSRPVKKLTLASGWTKCNPRDFCIPEDRDVPEGKINVDRSRIRGLRTILHTPYVYREVMVAKHFWNIISFLIVCVCVCVCTCVCVYVCVHTQSCPTLCNPWIVACQASLSMEFSRQEYWSGVPFPPLGILLTQGSSICLLSLLHW